MFVIVMHVRVQSKTVQKLFLKEQCIKSGAFSQALIDRWEKLPTR